MSAPDRAGRRIRHGYLSDADRTVLARMLDTVGQCLDREAPVPDPIRDAWRDAHRQLDREAGQ